MKYKISLSVLLLFSAATACWPDQTRTDAVERLQSSTRVMHQIVNVPEKSIPDKVLSGAKCIAIVPKLLKGGFILAAKHGRGVSTCRLPKGDWSAPAFFTISGGSWGAQIGVESVDLVLMVMTDEGMRHLLSDKFQIGGSVSAAVGPLGRDAAAGTDWKVDTQILTYSRAKGLFAGLDLGGSWVERDRDSTVAMYGKDLSTRALLEGEVPVPADARSFVAEIRSTQAHATKKKA